MHFSKPVLVIAAGLVAQATADGCHTSNDEIGKTCKFSDQIHWRDLVSTYCEMYDPGRVVPAGSSVGSKILVADGYGDTQYFWGNHRVDRGEGGPDKLITFAECYNDMMRIWDSCPQQGGGWVDTPSGTTFAECIRK